MNLKYLLFLNNPESHDELLILFKNSTLEKPSLKFLDLPQGVIPHIGVPCLAGYDGKIPSDQISGEISVYNYLKRIQRSP